MKKANLKETKKVLLNMLLYLDELFTKYNLNYSLAYGTLIGAARNKGFIPWDDDLDIVMPFEDYLKMLKIDELNNPNNNYSIHYAKVKNWNEKKYNYPFVKIEDNRTKCIFKYTNDQGGAFIDIFPMTPLPAVNYDGFSNKLNRLHYWLSFTFVRVDDPFKNFIHKLSAPFSSLFRDKMIHLAFKYINTEYDFLTDSTWSNDRVGEAVPKEWFCHYTKLSFEDHTFKVICNYDEWLHIIYGDWRKLPPKEKRVGHHYFDLYI